MKRGGSRQCLDFTGRGFAEARHIGMKGGAAPSGAVIAGGAKAAWFKDSQGNILALVQSL